MALPLGTESHESAIFFARPHEIDILRESPGASALSATIIDIRPLGATVRIELDREDGQGLIEVEMVRDHYQRIALKEGEAVFLQPKRLRVFGEHELQ